jgi:hypothetical protein
MIETADDFATELTAEILRFAQDDNVFLLAHKLKGAPDFSAPFLFDSKATFVGLGSCYEGVAGCGCQSQEQPEPMFSQLRRPVIVVVSITWPIIARKRVSDGARNPLNCGRSKVVSRA